MEAFLAIPAVGAFFSLATGLVAYISKIRKRKAGAAATKSMINIDQLDPEQLRLTDAEHPDEFIDVTPEELGQIVEESYSRLLITNQWRPRPRSSSVGIQLGSAVIALGLAVGIGIIIDRSSSVRSSNAPPSATASQSSSLGNSALLSDLTPVFTTERASVSESAISFTCGTSKLYLPSVIYSVPQGATILTAQVATSSAGTSTLYFVDQVGTPISEVAVTASSPSLSIRIEISNVTELAMGCYGSGLGGVTLENARFQFR